MHYGARKLFCFGLGYSAESLIQRLKPKGWQFAGTTRSRAGFARLEALGADPYVFSRESPLAGAAKALSGVTHVLSSIPPDDQGDPVVDLHGIDMVRQERLEWVGYLSTTGVYGDTKGEVADETWPLRPTSDRSRRRVEAETAWLSLKRERGLPVHIFRLPGIYGPGRSVFDQVREGRAKRIDKPGHVFSRIHVDDIAKGLALSMDKPDAGSIFNLTDNEAASPAMVTWMACQMLGMRAPPLVPFEQAKEDMSPMALSFWSDNRKVTNEKIRRVLGFEPDYPTYREGLSAVLKAERGG